MLIKAGDNVVVIAGADKGTRSRVVKIDRMTGKAIVEGVNKVFKHVKPSQKNPQGGRLSKEMPIPVGNIQYVCESCDAKSRLGARYTDEGAKERFCRKCGAAVGELAPAKARYAKK